MRTTLTLDDDVAFMLDRLRRAQGCSLKWLVNQALRAGLADIDAPERPQERYHQPASSLGGCLLPSLDDVAGVLEVAEGDAFR